MRSSWLAVSLLACVACGGDDGGGSGPADASGGGGGDGGGSAVDGGGSGTPVDAAPVVGEPAELQGITAAHNAVRAAVQTQTPLPALTWSNDLAATAAAWAAMCVDTMAPTGLIDHNPNRSNGHPYYVGENIYASSGTATAQGAVNSWASEGSLYTYPDTTRCGGQCGHFTQIVWRDTREVGCAIHTCTGLTYPSSIVCNYGPGGNYNNEIPY